MSTNVYLVSINTSGGGNASETHWREYPRQLNEFNDVKVRDNRDCKLITVISVSLHMSVGEVKRLIEEKTGIEVDRQNLYSSYFFAPGSKPVSDSELFFKTNIVNMNEEF
jgi:hypothetical protein